MPRRFVFTNLKTIITQLTANNQVVIRYVKRPNCLPERNLGDNSAVRQEAYISQLYQKVEYINKILRNAHIEKECVKSTEYCQKSIKTVCDFMGANLDKTLFTEYEKWKVLELPPTIKYIDIDSDNLVEIEVDTKELMLRRLALLDIIKKSQQSKKYERSWGKVQKDKTFTRNAKQKILESGAVVDRHVGSRNSFEVTLTVPGSGWDVYDVISRYSGYMVNRITQVIRRAEAKGCELHWFFVWEHQERGALHMHWCIACEHSDKVANLVACEITGKWYALLEELSEKTRIDLFKKRGFSGTWRYSPEIWQCNIARVRKSVAAYFSKYCSKNAHVKNYNDRRREHQARLVSKKPNSADSARVYSLSPTRYWGSSSRTKKLCAKYRVTIRFDNVGDRESSVVAGIIRKWVNTICHKLQEVSRTFKRISPDTGFIYASGWEQKLWFESSMMDAVLQLFQRIRSDSERKKDPVGALLNLDYF